MDVNTWLVRADGGELLDRFLQSGVVALGWHEVGDMSGARTREAVAALVEQAWPDDPPGRRRVWTGMLHRFRNVMAAGDRVITYESSSRTYHIGRVASDYQYDSKKGGQWPHVRAVEWSATVDRDDLSVSTKNELGAIMTLFKLSETAAAEVAALISGEPPSQVDDAEDAAAAGEDQLLHDIQARSREFIKDRVSQLGWDQMQELVAGLLRAMGYKTRVSPPGSDLGRDIVASPDGLGLEQPRIVVEVKHRKGAIGSPEIRSFLGGRHKDDKGLYVSTGGFTKDARYEADRASIPITLMDLDELVTALIEHYDDMDMDTRALVPLVSVYWPT